MKRLKERLLRILYADTLAAEALMGFFAVAQAYPRLIYVPKERVLAACVLSLGVVRIIALITAQLWARLVVAYVATFVWIYFILFVFLEEPGEYLPGAMASTAMNVWVAWRLQTEHHIRKDLSNAQL